jgi:hypothetical protein
MSDDLTNDPNSTITTARSFGAIPVRPREVRGASIADIEANMKREIERDPPAKSVALRTQARRDAMIAVSRARERAGIPTTNWTAIDADTVHAITDLLLNVQAQGAPTENAFADRA